MNALFNSGFGTDSHAEQLHAIAEVLGSPKEAYTQRLLAAVPLPDPEQQRARRALRLELLAAGSDEVVPVNEGLPQEPEPPVAQGL